MEELIKKYPDILCGQGEGPRKYNSYSLPLGWIPILGDFLRVADAENIEKNYVITCIKEKFGSLRIYDLNATKAIKSALSLAWKLSTVTCETCGKEGDYRQGSWIKVLCEDHAEGRPVMTPEQKSYFGG